jgi:hypothetical protein
VGGAGVPIERIVLVAHERTGERIGAIATDLQPRQELRAGRITEARFLEQLTWTPYTISQNHLRIKLSLKIDGTKAQS